MIQSKCTVGLLAHFAQAAYRVKRRDDGNDSFIDPTDRKSGTKYARGLMLYAENGYAITKAITPEKKGTNLPTGDKKTNASLAALCFEPQDNQSPIVISYRGTKTLRDVGSDMSLLSRGVVGKKFRDAAYEFYQEVRAQYPNREIILTGHSLGGHIAQYVATKAYHENQFQERDKESILVRTFNSAPIRTKHSVVFKDYPHLKEQYKNYRMSADIISDSPLKDYYGDSFVFKSNRKKAHSMDTVHQVLPEEVKALSVGKTPDNCAMHNRLLEALQGVKHSYQCRVNGQYFSRHRAGRMNLDKMDKAFPEIQKDIQNKDYDGALEKLAALKESVKGKRSSTLIQALMETTLATKLNDQKELLEQTVQSKEIPQPTESIKAIEPEAIQGFRAINHAFKAQMQAGREEERQKKDSEANDSFVVEKTVSPL
ncbi:lipase family protein [Legionella impletisoli]|uniref:Lipase (Class 3) n=1 Tax=Legionella impletisoli TaxID=343510 RepID=A0A917JYT0_9GAMM|nr:Mbeg1-like protein [Legionella impletisoli]GGI93274.1 hypothetical protein GCM10007966_22290 [Legionella impletisoli]